MNTITKNAYAKINLSLDILSTRPDGYHEVRMVMQSLTLHDTVTVQKEEGCEGNISVSSNLPFLPSDDRNLAVKASKLFFATYHINNNISIHLHKQIPVSAGLAGGSSNAAATFHALNELFDVHASLKELQKLGVQIGADVPYCLQLGTVLAEGIGEQLTALPSAPAGYCLLVKPHAGVSTKQVYTEYDALPVPARTDVDSVLLALEHGSFSEMAEHLGNVLEPVTTAMHPEILRIKTALHDKGALGTLMSGSGPTVFGLFSSAAKAKSAYDYFKNGPYGKQTFLTEFFNPTV